MKIEAKLPVIDLHCDLLSYLVSEPNASVNDTRYMGASLPHLLKGNVKLQTMAIFATTQPGSSKWGIEQAKKFRQLQDLREFQVFDFRTQENEWLEEDGVFIMPAIENASTFCEEDESLKVGFRRLEKIQEYTGPLFSIMLTHHYENRFGGGNYSPNVGLKDDGRELLSYLDGKGIALDLSHTSDALAEQSLFFIQKNNLDLRVIASHSNFRDVWEHVRNLPMELVQEITLQKGLIGINFLRDYIHPSEPKTILTHITHGLMNGAENCLAFGADFFFTKTITDAKRFPLFFSKMSNASYYPKVLKDLGKEIQSEKLLKKIAYENVLEFIKRGQN